jgi:hypothetical protein
VKALVMALATARLTQLVVDDDITEPVRAKLADAVKADPAYTWKDVLDEIVNCHACTSVWAGAGILLAGRMGPVGRFLVQTLALSQATLLTKTVIERIDR